MVRSCLASGNAKRQVTAGALSLPEAQSRRVSPVTRSLQGGRRVGMAEMMEVGILNMHPSSWALIGTMSLTAKGPR
jgi:hypothetical protein